MLKKVFPIGGLLALAAGLVAQPSFVRRTVATTGLFSLTPGHVAILTLADVGTRGDAAAAALVQILDDKNEVIAEARGTLRPGEPLAIRAHGDRAMDTRIPVRARVVVFTPRFSRRAAPEPILSFELLNQTTLDIAVAASCPMPSGVPGDRGPEFDCPPPPCHIDVI